MLPSGHLAAGYLTTKLALDSLSKFYPQANDPRFWAMGMVAAIIVDLDSFYAFFKIGSPIGSSKDINHRKFLSHAPLLHLGIGTLIFGAGRLLHYSDWELYGILYAVGMATHFLLDSFGLGLMWLWPFKNELYAFRRAGKDFETASETVFGYWRDFLKDYIRDFVFYLEAAVILSAILAKIFWKT